MWVDDVSHLGRESAGKNWTHRPGKRSPNLLRHLCFRIPPAVDLLRHLPKMPGNCGKMRQNIKETYRTLSDEWVWDQFSLNSWMKLCEFNCRFSFTVVKQCPKLWLAVHPPLSAAAGGTAKHTSVPRPRCRAAPWRGRSNWRENPGNLRGTSRPTAPSLAYPRMGNRGERHTEVCGMG